MTSAVGTLSTDPAAFEGITIASLLEDDASPDLGLFQDVGALTVSQLTDAPTAIERLDLGVEPIRILEDGDPENVQELSDDQIETLMLALDKAMMG